MKKSEFISGIAIISIVVILYYMFGNPVITHENIGVKITPVENTTVVAYTDEYGNVEVVVKDGE